MTHDARSPLGALRRPPLPAISLPPGSACRARLQAWTEIRRALVADLEDLISVRRHWGWDESEIRAHVEGVVGCWEGELRGAARRALDEP